MEGTLTSFIGLSSDFFECGQIILGCRLATL